MKNGYKALLELCSPIFLTSYITSKKASNPSPKKMVIHQKKGCLNFKHSIKKKWLQFLKLFKKWLSIFALV